MADRFAKIQDLPGHVKDTHTGAILSVDNAALEAYRKRKNREHEIDGKIFSIETKVDKIDNDLSEIKDILKIMMERFK